MSTNPPDPKFVVEDSPLKASITTFFSLLFFGITLAGAILHLASAQDLNGIRALMMRQDTIAFLTTVAPIAWAAWRTRRTWFKTIVDAKIAKAAPDEVAMPKSEVASSLIGDPNTLAAPPTRARETTIRVVDATRLHRVPAEILTTPGVDPASSEQFFADRDAVQALVPEQPREREELEPEVAPVSDLEICKLPPPGWRCTRVAGHDGPCAAWPDETAPRVPGDALDLLAPPPPHRG